MQIGPYILICELARGGMAQVWLALRLWPDGKQRPCVIKLPRRSAVTDEAVLQQFVEESRLSILLNHPNIVSVFDVGVHEGLPYLVMDYVPGVDLAQLLRAEARLGKQWTVETAVHLVRDVAQGLHHAHVFEAAGVHQQIVHRDVASKNVMVDSTGAVLLTDFGVATSIGTQTSRIHAKGTLPYMAPEHYLARASTASDVFGLGGIFWELLAGRPFRGGLEGQALVAAVVSGAVEPVGRELAANVRHVLEGMLHPDASQRISLPAVLAELEEFPSRRLTLKKMVSMSFGPASRRTGHSQLHFVASKELLDTLAFARIAGVSLSDRPDRELTGRPDPVPVDFAPVAVQDTAKVDPLALATAVDYEVSGEESEQEQAPSPSQVTELMGDRGGTLRSQEEGRTASAPSQPTLRLPSDLRGQRLASRTAEPDAPVPVRTQHTVRQLSVAAKPSVVGVDHRIDSSPPPPASSPQGRVRVEPVVRASNRVFLVAMLVLLVGLGAGAWASWPKEGDSQEGKVVAHTEPSVSLQAPPEKSEASPPPSAPKPKPKEDAAAMVELHSRLADPPPPSTDPPPTLQDAPPKAPPPVAAKPKPRPSKPVPKLELTVRSGLVAYAELKIGNGKPHVVPAKGALTLHVAPGTYTLRSRTSAGGAWTTIRYTFSDGMKYAVYVESSGLRIAAGPRGSR